MDKVICLNGHGFDAEIYDKCPECGAPADRREQTPFMTVFEPADGFSPSEPPPVRTIGAAAPFRTVFEPAGGFSPSEPPPVRTIGAPAGKETPPPPPVQSLRGLPPRGQAPAGSYAAVHAQPGQGQTQPKPKPEQPAAPVQKPFFVNMPPQNQPVIPGQPVPFNIPQGQPMGQPAPYINIPQGQPGGQPAPYMNMPQGQPPMGQSVPFMNSPAPAPAPAQMQGGDLRSQLDGIAVTAQMTPDMLIPPQPPQGDGDRTVALSYEETNTSLPVGCLIVLNGQAKGEMFKLRPGRNIIGRNGKGQEFAVDLKFNKKIHRAPQAVVSYDSASRTYSLIPCSGSRNPVYLNGSSEQLTGAVSVKSYDRILIEGTILMFIGFCGAQFSWELLN